MPEPLNESSPHDPSDEALRRNGIVLPSEDSLTPAAPTIAVPDREALAKELGQRLHEMADVLNEDGAAGNRWKDVVRDGKLKDLTYAYEKLADKLLVLQGQPNQIVATAERQKLERLLPALMKEASRRGITVDMARVTIPAG